MNNYPKYVPLWEFQQKTMPLRKDDACAHFGQFPTSSGYPGYPTMFSLATMHLRWICWSCPRVQIFRPSPIYCESHGFHAAVTAWKVPFSPSRFVQWTLPLCVFRALFHKRTANFLGPRHSPFSKLKWECQLSNGWRKCAVFFFTS